LDIVAAVLRKERVGGRGEEDFMWMLGWSGCSYESGEEESEVADLQSKDFGSNKGKYRTLKSIGLSREEGGRREGRTSNKFYL
tara:strand:- start:153 stop:401 length:249 start_codon:yes stop_codon:yes gene_type:complete